MISIDLIDFDITQYTANNEAWEDGNMKNIQMLLFSFAIASFQALGTTTTRSGPPFL